jgi:hypothetical protein
MTRSMAGLLSCFLVWQLCLASAWAQETGGQLNIVIVEGDGAINNIRQRTAREPIVQVEDQNHKPIAGAAVVFLLPDQGASGVFANGSHTLTVMTDAQGRAVARGFRPNNVQGKLQMHVTASNQGQTASATISQTNAVGAAAGAAAGGVSAKLITILIIAGAAVAGGVVAATRGGSSSTTPTPPTTISAGTGTVTAPH